MLWKSRILALGLAHVVALALPPGLIPQIAHAAPGNVIFVDDSAVGGANDGSSWANAFLDLQDALAVAAAGDQIRVGQGVYKPAPPNGPREATFNLVSGTIVRGGYAGHGAQHPNDNDPVKFPTVLNGDLNGDDGPYPYVNNVENSYHVVTAINADANTVLRGVIVSRGNAARPVECDPLDIDLSGGGIRCVDSNLLIRDCVIQENRAKCRGAGMVLSGGAAQVFRCLFQYNATAGVHDAGGALWTIGEHEFVECDFYANHSSWFAGAASVQGGRFVACSFVGNSVNESSGALSGWGFTLIDCIIDNNQSGTFAGGITASSADIINCRFTRNRNSICGPYFGSIRFFGNVRAINCVFTANGGSSPAIVIQGTGNSIVNCSVFGNTPPFCGPGGIRIEGGLTLANSVVWGNTAESAVGEAAQVLVMPSANLTVANSCIQGWTGSLGGIGNHGNDPRFIDADGPDNVYGTADDNPRLRANSLCIDSGNSALLPADTFDLDEDGDITESLPLDLDHLPRVVGANVDSGAFEFQGTPCRADIDGSNAVDADDLVTVILAWGACPVGEPCPADLNLNMQVEADDLTGVILAWGSCP